MNGILPERYHPKISWPSESQREITGKDLAIDLVYVCAVAHEYLLVACKCALA